MKMQVPMLRNYPAAACRIIEKTNILQLTAQYLMMKILLILPRFDRHKWDSLTEQAWCMARLLSANGVVQCSIAAGRSEGEKSLEVISNVSVHRFSPQLPRWKFLRRFCRCKDDFSNADLPGLELFLRKNKFDLVHIMCRGYLCQKVSQVLKERHIPYIVGCRSEDFRISDVAVPQKTVEVNSNFRKVLREYGEALQGAARVFCSDHALRRMLAVELGDRPLIHWQPGVEIEKFSRPAQLDFRQFYQIPPSRRIILSVGRIGESKNQKMLLEILSVLNKRQWKCHLVVIGWNSSDAYMQEFNKLAAEHKLENVVSVIPGLPPGDECFRAAFQASSLVILPSRFDVSGSAVLEAWAASVPVIAAPVGCGGELIEDGVNGRLVNPRDLAGMIKTCEELLDERNRSACEKMRSNGMMKARNLRWERRLEELTDIYKSILNINQHK